MYMIDVFFSVKLIIKCLNLFEFFMFYLYIIRCNIVHYFDILLLIGTVLSQPSNKMTDYRYQIYCKMVY
jgi:hypothetical protein